MNTIEKNEALAQTPPETLAYYARLDEIIAMGGIIPDSMLQVKSVIQFTFFNVRFGGNCRPPMSDPHGTLKT